MQFPDSFFEDEVRDGFYIPALMKRAWAAQLEVLGEIARICEKYKIRWFADRGSLLGAVRHSGYIPWDDDLDICMLREDYNLFNSVAEKELAEGYFIPRIRKPEYRTFTTVWNRNVTCLDQEHLKRFHGFPYPAGVDIFVLDHLAPDPEDEECRSSLAVVVANAAVSVDENNQHTEESEVLIAEVENLLRVKIDRSAFVQEQLFVLLDNVFSLYMHETLTDVAFMPNWIFDHTWRFPVECYQDSLQISFEETVIAVPAQYPEALRIQFGEHYMTPYRVGGGHDYPCYQRYEEQLQQLLGEYYPLLYYQFSMDDMHIESSKSRHGMREVVQNFFNLAGSIHKKVQAVIDAGEPGVGLELLEACQNTAIQVGTMLEERRGRELVTVRLLEEYCELLWQIHQVLENGQLSVAADSTRNLDMVLAQTEDIAGQEIMARKEVVFFPFRASAWDSLEPLWRKAVADPDCDVYVVPIPWYYRNLDGTLRDRQYEGAQFPDYVPVTDYQIYDVESRQPDVICIHNPYDEYNLTTSVDPGYYARNLRQCTECLVYTPYFILDNFDQSDERSVKNMKHYVSMPGVVLSDRVLVQSEAMRTMYVEHLTAFAGGNTRPLWEERIAVYLTRIQEKDSFQEAKASTQRLE